MSHILTTVYATDEGAVAARYAAGLASSLGLPLRIIYPFTVPVTVGEMPMPMMPVDELQESAKARLSTIKSELQGQYPSLEISIDVPYGMLADALADNEASAPALTIISNDEAEDGDSWIGNESATIMREGPLSVLAISRTAIFRQPQQVCIACDTRSIMEGLPLAALLRLKEQLGFRLTVLHVAGDGGSENLSYEGSALHTQLSGQSAGYAEVSVAGNVDEAIAAYADTHGMDWLALAPHHYGFWEGLFHKSHTSKVLHLAHVPVLALHGGE